MDAGKVALGILAVAGVCGLIYFITRPSHTSSEPKALPPGRETRQYSNTETWDIDWDEDGLPKRVVITRRATET